MASTDITFSLSIIAIWSVSSVLASPALLHSTTKTYSTNKTSSTACLLVWPDGESYVSLMDHVYQIIYLLMTYILPLVGLSLTYTYLSRTLWRLQWQPSALQEPDRRAKKEMRKVAKMFIVILILFGVCWLPYHAYFLVQFYYPVIARPYQTTAADLNLLICYEGHHEAPVHTAHLPHLLLAGHGQLRHQPDCLLHHECQVGKSRYLVGEDHHS